MRSRILEPAFDYLAAVPRTRETTIHSKVKNAIVDSIRNADSEMPTVLVAVGSEGTGKTSLLNSLNFTINNKLKGEYLPIPVKIEADGNDISKVYLLRQLFDQVWELLLSKDLVSINTPEYQDWVTKLDLGNVITEGTENPLRSASILAAGTQDNSKELAITSGLISTDWRSLLSIARRNMPRLKNFVLIVDNLETYRGPLINNLFLMLTAFPGNIITSAYHEKNSPYFDDFFSKQDWRIETFLLEHPATPEFDRLIISELDRINAPRKYLPTSRSFNDICETSGRNLVDFLIVANAIWEEIRAGRLSKFEINKTVLNRALKIMKSNSSRNSIAESGQNVISEIEKLAHHRETKFEDIVDILSSKSLTLEEIVKVRNLPEVLDQEKIEKELIGLKKAFDLLRQSEIIIALGQEGMHKGLKDRYIESYIRCLQRDFRASRKGKSLAIGNPDFTSLSLIEIWRRVESLVISSTRQFLLHITDSDSEDEEINKIFNSIRNESILEIQEVLAKRQISVSRGRGTDKPTQFYTIEIQQVRSSGSSGITLGGVIEAPRKQEEIEASLDKWREANLNLLSYLGITSLTFQFALLAEDPTQDLTDISLANSKVSSGMRTFQEHDYQSSFTVFNEGATRLKSILDRYGETIPKSSQVYKNIKDEIADLDVRAAFVQTLLGDMQAALVGFESINRRDLLQDDVQWLYLDDYENALAFSGNLERALEVNLQAARFRENNIYEGYEREKGTRYLLMYVPDRDIFERTNPQINEKYLYDAGSIHDKKIPKLRELFYLHQLKKISSEDATSKTLALIEKYDEIFSPPIIRLFLWNLYRFGGNEQVLKEIIEGVELVKYDSNHEAEDLYDDISTLKRLIR